MELVKKINVNTRKELNDFIYNMNSTFYNRYVFRGHADDKYILLPNILRGISTAMTNQDIVFEETRSLIKFFRECNNQGLKVPDIKKFRANYMSGYFDLSFVMNDLYYWPDASIFELGALAQHYGLKTRFLDWTQDIRVALYFSCDNATNKSIDYCSIWAINADYIQKRQNIQKGDAVLFAAALEKESGSVLERELLEDVYDEDIPLKFCVPAYCDNPNINAQKGILSVWQYNMIAGIAKKEQDIISDRIKFNMEVSNRFEKFFNSPADTSDLTLLFEEYFSHNDKEKRMYEEYISSNKNKPIDYLFYKIIFPNAISADLKKQLQTEGYNTARLFPGYKGVADYLKEKAIGDN